MTRKPVRPTTIRRVPSVRCRNRSRRNSKNEDTEELQQTDTKDTGGGDREQNTRTVPLSARDRLILTCLAENGKEQRIIRLAQTVATTLDGRCTDINADVQRTFLTVRSSIEDLAEQGLVTYCQHRGTVQLG
jgi:predicted transcriptional regulator